MPLFALSITRGDLPRLGSTCFFFFLFLNKSKSGDIFVLAKPFYFLFSCLVKNIFHQLGSFLFGKNMFR